MMQTLPCTYVCIIAFIRQTVCFNLNGSSLSY